MFVASLFIIQGQMVIACGLFSEISYADSNLKYTCSGTKEQHRLQGLMMQEVCEVPSPVPLARLTILSYSSKSCRMVIFQ